jgi:NAD(P)-dependent dehydrogenase (short-subunit alcohol dehydrogenase family)
VSLSAERRHEGRVCVVTGGGNGIGAAAAVRLAAEGARVAVADIRFSQAQAVAAKIVATGGQAFALACDVSDEAQVEQLFERSRAEFGPVGGLFANAGTVSGGWVHELTLDQWRSVLDVNLTGVFLCAKHALRQMMPAGCGAIVTTGSIASVVVGPGGSAASYAASKGGLLQLTRQIAVDYAPHGIRALCVLPGFISTDIGRHGAEDLNVPEPATRLPRSKPWWPLQRRGTPDEVAAAVSFLISDEAAFMTGTSVTIDGGLTAV